MNNWTFWLALIVNAFIMGFMSKAFEWEALDAVLMSVPIILAYLIMIHEDLKDVKDYIRRTDRSG